MTKFNNLKLILTFIIKCVCYKISNSDAEFVLDSLSTHCPYLSTCSQQAQQEFTYSRKKYMPCCQECSCSPLCHVEGNCCPDVSYNVTDFPGEVSSEQALSSNRCIQPRYPGSRSANGNNANMFNAIVTCPEEHPNNDIAHKCTAEEPTRIEQVLLVSDDNDTIYRNIYCAQCNRAQGIYRWSAIIKCNFLAKPDESFHIELSHILDRKCKLISMPLSQRRGSLEKKRCFVPDISECNMTGAWDVYDQYTERACQTVNSVYLLQYVRSVYKNVFCFMCNGYQPSQRDVCPAPDYLDKGGFGAPFTALLDFNVFTLDSDKKPQRCRRQEIYDPIFLRCRELICPPETSPVNGECVRAFIRSDGLTMTFYYKIQPIDELKNVPSEREGQMILTEAYSYLTGKVNPKCRLCKTWGRDLAMPLANYTLVMEMNILTTPYCSWANLLNNMQGESFFISINNGYYMANFSIQRLDRRYIDQHPNIYKTPHLFYNMGEATCTIGATSRLISCPRIFINGLDFKAASRNNSISNPSRYTQYNIEVFEDHELVNMTFELCVADYIHVGNSVRSHTAAFYRCQVGIFVLFTFLAFSITMPYILV